jgi:hypothetical protein
MPQNLKIITNRQNDTNGNTHPTSQKRDNPVKVGEYDGDDDGYGDRADTNESAVEAAAHWRGGRSGEGDSGETEEDVQGCRDGSGVEGHLCDGDDCDDGDYYVV